MFLGLAEEVSDTKDELDEEDKAALTCAYAQIEEIQRRIEAKRLAHILPCARVAKVQFSSVRRPFLLNQNQNQLPQG